MQQAAPEGECGEGALHLVTTSPASGGGLSNLRQSLRRHAPKRVCLHVKLAPEGAAATADQKVGAVVGTIKKFLEEERRDDFFCYVDPGALFMRALSWQPPRADLKDMYFMREHEQGLRGHLVNTGFMCVRPSKATLTFWRKVRKRMAAAKAPDQPVVNEFVRKRLHAIPWAFVPEDAALAKHSKHKCSAAPESSLYIFSGGHVDSRLYRKSVSVSAGLGIGCAEPPSGDLWRLQPGWKLNKKPGKGNLEGGGKKEKTPTWRQKLNEKYEQHLADLKAAEGQSRVAGGGGGQTQGQEESGRGAEPGGAEARARADAVGEPLETEQAASAEPLADAAPATAVCEYVGAPSGLRWCDERTGTGDAARPGETRRFKYVGSLQEGGPAFDSSLAATFEVGTGKLIRGWDEGVVGSAGGGPPAMRAGGLRRLVVPPELGYGERGAGGGVIPPNSTLFFSVELLFGSPP